MQCKKKEARRSAYSNHSFYPLRPIEMVRNYNFSEKRAEVYYKHTVADKGV